jgi:hypothetical protein
MDEDGEEQTATRYEAAAAERIGMVDDQVVLP